MAPSSEDHLSCVLKGCQREGDANGREVLNISTLGSAACGLGAMCNPEQNSTHKPSVCHGKAGVCSDRQWNLSEMVQDALVHRVPNYGQIFQGKEACRKGFYSFPSVAAKMWCSQAREEMLKQSHAGTPESQAVSKGASLEQGFHYRMNSLPPLLSQNHAPSPGHDSNQPPGLNNLSVSSKHHLPVGLGSNLGHVASSFRKSAKIKGALKGVVRGLQTVQTSQLLKHALREYFSN